MQLGPATAQPHPAGPAQYYMMPCSPSPALAALFPAPFQKKTTVINLRPAAAAPFCVKPLSRRPVTSRSASVPPLFQVPMAEIRTRSSSFSRNPSIGSTSLSPGLKPGPNGSFFVSSGIPDLDKILGGGISLGSLVMVMEDPEAPHHMLLLRNFMAQGLIHDQPLLFASPSSDPRGFLGTLPKPYVSKDRRSHAHESEQEKNLRIAWQYKKYFDGNQQTSEKAKHEYCTEFDLRSPLERHALIGKRIECISTQDCAVDTLLERCSGFLAQNVSRNNSTTVSCPGRIAIQSLCSPQCGYYGQDWDMLSFIKSLKQLLRSSNAVAVVTFPQSVLSPSFSKRWMHLADTLISTRAIPDDDKDLTKLLTGYQDMVGLLNVHKVARMNSQVPFVLEATTFSIKLHRRRSLVLECLNQAPVDGSSGSSYGSNCSSKTVDF